MLSLLLIWTVQVTFASVVVSEVHWAGSYSSSADEWVEMVNTSTGSVSLHGWRLTTQSSSGQEKDMVLFDGTVMESEDVLLITNFDQERSEINTPPDIVTTKVSLPNTKLLLRLRNIEGEVVDEVDDGIGAPFAGSNPSKTTGLPKASMQRIDLSASGTEKDNWKTAEEGIGVDLGSLLLGSPGHFDFKFPVADALASDSAEGGDVVRSRDSTIAESEEEGPEGPKGYDDEEYNRVRSVITTRLEKKREQAIFGPTGCPVQHWEGVEVSEIMPTGDEWIELFNTTNHGVVLCGWLLDDTEGGSRPFKMDGHHIGPFERKVFPKTVTKLSLNDSGDSIRLFAPPLIKSGSHILIDDIGFSSIQKASSLSRGIDGFVWTLHITPGTENRFYKRAASSPLRISAALPNAEGRDEGKEWIEIHNTKLSRQQMVRWSVVSKGKSQTLHPYMFSSGEVLRVPLASISLKNTNGLVELANAQGQKVSALEWEKAGVDEVIFRGVTPSGDEGHEEKGPNGPEGPKGEILNKKFVQLDTNKKKVLEKQSQGSQKSIDVKQSKYAHSPSKNESDIPELYKKLVQKELREVDEHTKNKANTPIWVAVFVTIIPLGMLIPLKFAYYDKNI